MSALIPLGSVGEWGFERLCMNTWRGLREKYFPPTLGTMLIHNKRQTRTVCRGSRAGLRTAVLRNFANRKFEYWIVDSRRKRNDDSCKKILVGNNIETIECPRRRFFAENLLARLSESSLNVSAVSPWCNPFAKWIDDWLVGVAADIVSFWSSSLYPFLFPLRFSFPLTAETQLVVADFFDFHSFIEISFLVFLVYFFPSVARVLVAFHSRQRFFFSFEKMNNLQWHISTIFSFTFDSSRILALQRWLSAFFFARENIFRRFSTNYIKEKLSTEIIFFSFSRHELIDDLQLARNDHLQLKWESDENFPANIEPLSRNNSLFSLSPPTQSNIYHPLTARRSERIKLFAWWKSC